MQGGEALISISLCMIVKNEEEVLGRCLESVGPVADEIVILDTGSTDRTKEIARQFTDQVYDYPWQGDFAAARNAAFLKATKEFWLWLDADDVLPKVEQEKLLALKNRLSALDVDVVMMQYATSFDEAGNPTFRFRRERLIKNIHRPVWEGRVHEMIAPFGKVLQEDITVYHKKLHVADPDRNLNIYRDMEAKGQSFSARELYYFGRELFYHRLWQEAADRLKLFLDRNDGWLPDRLEACRLRSAAFDEMGQQEKALDALLEGLKLSVPRGELCCALGYHFLNQDRFAEAIFWYEAAYHSHLDPNFGGFVQEECYHYLPAIQLCLCHDRLGNWKEAQKWNEVAKTFRPQSEAVQWNEAYFAKKRKEEETPCIVTE